MTEDEMVGWHHGLNGHGFGIWGRKESDTNERFHSLAHTYIISEIYICKLRNIHRMG